ncbi:MAG: MFS transporter [Kangiellaceae bacterium]|jgi:MFS family permease|nr:MFS transporter [Kangiellaceae bacterium]
MNTSSNNQTSTAMNSVEKRAALSLSAVFAVRMLGLFMILPIFAVAGQQLEGATPLLIGVAIGAYGLTQAIFQIPFGRLSDRFGRFPVIITGLSLFAIGSVVAALADHIYWVIIGRLLQGAGAIASAVMALAADLSRDEQRSKVMASIGMSIGAAFTLAMFLGPFITETVGLSGLFWTSAILALVAIAIVLVFTPRPVHRYVQPDAVAMQGQFAQVLANPQLWRLNFGIFALHFLLTAFFVAFPLKLAEFGLSMSDNGWVYLIVMIIAVIVMVPMIIVAEKGWKHRQVMVLAMCSIAVFEMLIGSHQGALWLLVLLLGLFFAGFNVMEALFPSLISRIAPPSAKGTALGVYSTSQFLGAALGAPLAGWLAQTYGISATYTAGAIIAVIWALAGLGLKSPPRLTAYTFTVHHLNDHKAFAALLDEIHAIEGVAEAVALPEAGAVYLKVDKQEFDEAALHKLKNKEQSI